MSRAEDRVEQAPPKSPRTNKYHWCEDAIIRTIIQPYLIGLIEKHQPSSKVQLLELFREATGYTACSQTTLDGWLEASNISASRRLEFDYPKAPEPEPDMGPEPVPLDDRGRREASAGGGPSGPPAAAQAASPQHGGLRIPGLNHPVQR